MPDHSIVEQRARSEPRAWAPAQLVQWCARAVSDRLGRNSWFIHRGRRYYEALLEWLTAHQGIPFHINGATYRIGPRFRCHFTPDYESDVAEFLSGRVRPGDTCFDIGANVGAYVLQFAHWSAPEGRIVAFEPNVQALEALTTHVQLNHLQDRVVTVPAAVADFCGRCCLYTEGTSVSGRLAEPSRFLGARAQELDVPVITIDAYSEQSGLQPDWILLDVEGFEFSALAGARRTIARRGSSLQMIVELHPDLWQSAGTTRRSAAALLSDLGVEITSLDGHADPLAQRGHIYLRQRGNT